MNAIRRSFQSADGDRGAALGLVIIIGFVLAIVVATATTFAVSGLNKSDNDSDFNGAIAAAYAGVEDYQSRMSNDNSYVQFGNPAAPFTIETGSQTKVVLPLTENPAFGVGAGGKWATVPGSDGTASYRYEVDNAKYSDSGILRLRSTGRVGNQVRSLVVNLKQQGFIDFLWFTDFEIQDPDQSGVDYDDCVKYAYDGRPSSTNKNLCGELAFGNGDVINGPAHSNDTMRVCDATFNGVVTTANNPASGIRYTKRDSNGSTCSGQTFAIAGSPGYSKQLPFPATNSEMRKEIRYDLVERPGCLYTGPTSIVFNSNGTMTVRSPLTRVTQLNGATPPVGLKPAECGTPGNGAGQLGSSTGQTINVLSKNLIFVQNVPVATNDPNYTSTTAVRADCKNASGVVTNGIGYPSVNEDVSGGDVPTKDIKAVYGCRVGDVFVKGDIHGTMTIAAENYVYVVDNIRYVDAQADMLGLVGNNAVWVWNPVKSNGDSLLNNSGRRIDSAILSVAHTFQVQNYVEGGNRGTLTVNGAIAQKFRGIVRYGSNGYAKNYVYDMRFRYMAPPKFLSPVSTSYGVSELVEVADGYKSNGSLP